LSRPGTIGCRQRPSAIDLHLILNLPFMIIQHLIDLLQEIAPPAYQEDYDNAGLITGSGSWNCTGALISLDATEDVVNEAIRKQCNLVISHHPIIFKGLKKLNGKNYVERAVITAIKNDVALYAIHTNLDNIKDGVNGKMADLLGLGRRKILQTRPNTLKKLFTFVPLSSAEEVRNAIFQAGAGRIGNYSECSFNTDGTGTFKASQGADPFVGNIGERHLEAETRLEVIFPAHLENRIISAMRAAHPYEEVAFDVIALSNTHPEIGSGLIGELETPVPEREFLQVLRERFKPPVIRHTALTGRLVKTVALCGGAGSFLVADALAQNADVYITADMKYHEFFDADGRTLIADIGHYESEQFTTDLIYDILHKKFGNFALLKTEVNTNPVKYFAD
jgi:dinuclear metal center YbgI/SA1388 family protein